jgi:hypothetical protein
MNWAQRRITFFPGYCISNRHDPANHPWTTAHVARDHVVAFVSIREIYFFANVGRNLVLHPEINEIVVRVFGVGLQEELFLRSHGLAASSAVGHDAFLARSQCHPTIVK